MPPRRTPLHTCVAFQLMRVPITIAWRVALLSISFFVTTSGHADQASATCGDRCARASHATSGSAHSQGRSYCPPGTDISPRNCDDVRRIASDLGVLRGYLDEDRDGVPDVLERPYVIRFNDCSTGNAHVACMFNHPCTAPHGKLLGLRSVSAHHATVLFVGSNGRSFECDFTPQSSGRFIGERTDTQVGPAFPDPGESLDPAYDCERNGVIEDVVVPPKYSPTRTRERRRFLKKIRPILFQMRARLSGTNRESIGAGAYGREPTLPTSRGEIFAATGAQVLSVYQDPPARLADCLGTRNIELAARISPSIGVCLPHAAIAPITTVEEIFQTCVWQNLSAHTGGSAEQIEECFFSDPDDVSPLAPLPPHLRSQTQLLNPAR